MWFLGKWNQSFGISIVSWTCWISWTSGSVSFFYWFQRSYVNLTWMTFYRLTVFYCSQYFRFLNWWSLFTFSFMLYVIGNSFASYYPSIIAWVWYLKWKILYEPHCCHVFSVAFRSLHTFHSFFFCSIIKLISFVIQGFLVFGATYSVSSLSL